LGNYAAQNVDNLVVGRWLGAEALGIYSRAYFFLMQPANLFGAVADQVLFPAMAKVQNETSRLAGAYRTVIGIIALATVPTSVIFVVFGREIVVILLGPNWEAVALPFQFLAVSLFFRTSYKIAGTLARARGFVVSAAWRQWLYAGLVAAGALVGQHWGIPGVAAGTAAAVFLQYVIMTGFALQLTRTPIAAIVSMHLGYGMLTVPLVVVAISIHTLGRAFHLADLVVVAAGTVAVAASMLGLLRYFSGPFQAELNFISSPGFPLGSLTRRLLGLRAT
jgi:PST family polysaccharide transporter